MRIEILENTFVVPVGKEYLIYNPLVGLTALVNKAAITGLKEHFEADQLLKRVPSDELQNLITELEEGEIKQPQRKSGKFNPDFLGIIPTRSCNGLCNYCDFGAETASLQSMSYQSAVEIVEWYYDMLLAKNRNIFDIHFFGGEPMVARDVIEVILHRTRLLCSESKIIPFFEISTNGQYSKNDADFIGRYFNKVILSFDGFKEFQDNHRPLKGMKSSYSTAFRTAKILGDSNSGLCIRCCISHLNVEKMPDLTKWFCEEFKLSAINYEILTATEQTESNNLYPPDPIRFAVNFQKSRALGSKYGIDIIYASDISEQPQVSSCPVGKDVAIVTPDGRISNCYLLPEKWKASGLDLDFGIHKGKYETIIDTNKLIQIRKMVEDKPRCSACFCKWTCAGGCHVGNSPPGGSVEFNKFCAQTRLISCFSLLENLHADKYVEHLIDSARNINAILSQSSDLIFSEGK